MANAALKDERIFRLPASKLRAADYHRGAFRVAIPSGTPYEAVVDPAYWSHVSAKLRPYDKVEAIDSDGAWYAEFLVIDVGTGFVVLHELLRADLPGHTATVDAAAGYELKYIPSKKWTVIRKADRLTIKDNEQSKESASLWLVDHLKTINK